MFLFRIGLSQYLVRKIFFFTKIFIDLKIVQIVDRDSYILIWELLILLMKQKNTIDGSDIAELLLKDRKDIHLPYTAAAAKKSKPIEKVRFSNPS